MARTLVKTIRIDERHIIDKYHLGENNYLYYPAYKRGEGFQYYSDGNGGKLAYSDPDNAKAFISDRLWRSRGVRLRNDGSGRREITERDIRQMRTDGWTQSQLRSRKGVR